MYIILRRRLALAKLCRKIAIASALCTQALEQQLARLLPDEKGKRAYMVCQAVASAHRSSNRVCLMPVIVIAIVYFSL